MAHAPTQPGCCKKVFVQQVVTTIHSLATHMNFMDFNLRFGEYNHTETLLERVTFATDGFPITVCQPGNRFLEQ